MVSDEVRLVNSDGETLATMHLTPMSQRYNQVKRAYQLLGKSMNTRKFSVNEELVQRTIELLRQHDSEPQMEMVAD